MEILLVVVGKIKEEYYRNKIKHYVTESNKHNKMTVIELEDESIPKNAGDNISQIIKEKEGIKILEKIEKNDYVVALCIEGDLTDTDKLRMVIDKAKNNQNKRVVFIIGGSLGLHDMVTRRADYKLSFSKMTFPHQLMRVMLLEQLAKL